MIEDFAKRWQTAFYSSLVADSALATTLRDASLSGSLRTWTAALTGAVVGAFDSIGLKAASKGHRGTELPLGQQEYLGQDVMVFTPGQVGWRFPIAVCELENSADNDRVAYSLWKTLCIRTQLRTVFCYRRDPRDASALVSLLADDVVSNLPVADRTRLEGETLVTVGSRNEADTFPYGFFESWKLNLNTGRFERFPRS